jgi:hypothetical protein
VAHSSVASSTPTRRTEAGSSATARSLDTRSAGSAAPENWASRSIWATLVTGMIPGITGRLEPSAESRSRSRKYPAGSKKNCVIAKAAPASALATRTSAS